MTQDPTPDHEALSEEAEAAYEAPSVEELNTEDSPAVTAAGIVTISDLRLKGSLRTLDGAIYRLR
jgi:hypothetical protein